MHVYPMGKPKTEPVKRVVIGCKWTPEPAEVRDSVSGNFWQRNTPGELMSADELKLQRALLNQRK